MLVGTIIFVMLHFIMTSILKNDGQPNSSTDELIRIKKQDCRDTSILHVDLTMTYRRVTEEHWHDTNKMQFSIYLILSQTKTFASML